MSVTAKLDTRQVDRRMRRLHGQLRTKGRAMKQIGRIELQEAQNRVRQSKVSPDMVPWQRWSYSTMISRVRDGSAGKGLLYLSGLLLKSFKMKASATAMSITNTAPYAGFLQEGTSNMPARPFLGFGRAAMKRIEKVLMKHLKR